MKTSVALILVVTVGLVASVPFSTMDNFIEELNKESKLWTASKQFDSMEEVKPLLGALEDPRDNRVYREGSFEAVKNYQAPEAFDARQEWSKCQSISKVWDQANCGSCWAVAAAGSMSDRLCIHKGVQTMISAENLMDCCSSCGSGCNGGYMYMAWHYWKRVGLVSGGLYGETDSCQPYSLPNCDHHVEGKYGPCSGEVPTPKCKHSCTNDAYSVSFQDDKTYAKSAYDVRKSEEAIMEEIQTNGPVEAGVRVYEDFPTYTSGVYHHVKGKYMGGHAIRIIGWGVEDGVKYWLVANSWNEGWGDNGLIKFLRGTNECGIESSVVAGLPK